MRESDADMLWAWRNEDSTRAEFFDTERVPWEDHLAWFRARLNNPDCRIFIGEERNVAFGQVRYERDGQGWDVSISVAEGWRGARRGTELLARTISRIPGTVKARIKLGNTASEALFRRAGFQQVDRTDAFTEWRRS